MALDTAIKNVGDYYAAHYLADKNGFSKDIVEKSKAWKEQGSNSVLKRLQGLSDAYFKAKARALDYPEPALRSKADSIELKSWHSQVLQALGYHSDAFGLELSSEQKQLPALLRLNRHNQPWLVICEAAFCLSGGDNDEEPLETEVIPASKIVERLPTYIQSWEKAVAMVFKQDDRPRWLMLLAGSRIYLFDAHTYAQGRYLYIDLDEAFGLKQTSTFEAICALLAKESLAPEGESDEVLHERLREGSLKSTHSVSEKLQSAVRDAIETIANGWVEARRSANQGYRQLGEQEKPLPDGSREVRAEQLRHDALIYVYRLLFCLYAEARGGELGILPINDDIYRLGYSLEALRDLVEQTEPTTTTENGTYFAEHLNRLFTLIHQGFHPEQDNSAEGFDLSEIFKLPTQTNLFEEDTKQPAFGRKQLSDSSYSKTFVIEPLTATLFAPNTTPLLERVKLPNRVLHKVIRCLSLGTGDKSKRIGRINYAELGIVQLGSVYEGLLSYKGFFAKEDLIQVLQKDKDAKPVLDNAIDPKVPTWFVPINRAVEFKPGEIILEHRTKKPRIYKTGEFILHLNGVDRVNSASYYTPEVLTRCLVSEALKERLKNFGPELADEILNLKICEPAMGSAAFLVEAIDQLAREYLRLKQAQLGLSIDPSDYEDELRRVKHYIAVHNVYGVDLNPTAVELGALSLWLASMHHIKVKTGENGNPDQYRPGATPWFGLRLRAGNSLIGARRAVWTEQQLITGAFYGKDAEAPRQLKPGEDRKTGEIYHFLVWDEDMAPAANDALMKQYWPTECEAIKEWRNHQVKKRWSPEEIAHARSLCQRIDTLWQDYAVHRVKGLKDSECTATVWPTPTDSLQAIHPSPSLAQQERIKANLEAESGAFQRLKLLMDNWCSFYFWPLQDHDKLPSRTAWLTAADILLGCDAGRNEASIALLNISLGHEINLEALLRESQQQLPEAGKLADAVPWYGVARSVDDEQHFHHWELIFTETLGPAIQHIVPRGFDLMFGNPPWMKVTWNDAPLLGEFDPLLGARDAKSAQYNSERLKLLKDEQSRLTYREAFTQAQGSSAYLNDKTLYPALSGVQTNLYKNFIERSWALLFSEGVAGLLHPEGVFDDPNGGGFRSEYYRRLLAHYQLKNELILFADVHHVMAFSINVYRGQSAAISFRAIFNLFSPNAITHSTAESSSDIGSIPGIKNDAGGWETRGHPQRVIHITENELGLFAKLFEDEGTHASQARLPQVHSQPLLKVLEKFAAVPQRLADVKGQYMATVMFDETYAQRDGIIKRMENPSYQPENPEDWVISGPHFYVGNPLNKTPRSICTANGNYDSIDLESISEDYLPRAVYRPGDKDGNLDKFYAAIPEWPKPNKPYQDECGEWQGGFWPIEDDVIPAWEALLGEPLKRYSIDAKLPGAKTARQFGYFEQWSGDVESAVFWLKANNANRNSEDFNNRVQSISVRQKTEISQEQLKRLPIPFTARERFGVRRLCQSANERTLIGSLFPPGTTAINAVLVTAFINNDFMYTFATFCSSILADFVVKISGRGNIYESNLRQIPFPQGPIISLAVEISKELQQLDKIRSKHRRYQAEADRRLAEIEIDVLCAMQIGITVEELIQIYTVQFPVMKSYEEADQYDAKGRRLPNTNRKDAGAKELRDALKNHDGVSPVTVSWEIDNGNQTVTKTFYPPFNHVDRIEDYKTAYRVFSERLGLTSNEASDAAR
jgi:hypothetical protein